MAKKSATAKKTSKKPVAKKSASKKSTPKKSAKKDVLKKWSKKISETSNAMDLEKDVFKLKDPKKIAASVAKKAGPFQSAMGMINFYENRAGKNLSVAQKKVLDASKNELRKLYGREEE